MPDRAAGSELALRERELAAAAVGERITTPPRGPARSGLSILVAACSAALLIPLLLPLFSGRVFAYNDLAWFHLPLRQLYQQALRAGDTVLWTPSIFAGMYIHGEGQIGAFHPFHQLLYRLFPLGAAFNLETAASYPAAFIGTFWLLRRLRLSTPAALFGAMLFGFSGFNLLHHHHVNMVAIVAHMPWLLAVADIAIVDDRPGRRLLAFAAIAAIVASEILLGFPQGVWWNMLALGAFGLVRAVEMRQPRRLLRCAAAVILGALLGGIQLLPTIDMAAHSSRMEIAREFALTYSLHPYNLFQLFSPYFFARGAYSETDYMWFHEFGIYSGAILPVASIWVCIRRNILRPRWILIAASLLSAAAALVLALGQYGGIGVLLSYVPGVGSLRGSVRYVVLLQLALAIVSAIAFDDLLDIAAGRAPSIVGLVPALWIPTALGVATLVALNGRLLPYGQHTFSDVSRAGWGVAIVATVTMLVYLAGRRARWAVFALVVVTAADLWLWGIEFVRRQSVREIQQLTDRVAPAPGDPADAYAAAPAQGPYPHNLLVLRGYRLATGYAGLYPATTHPIEGHVSLRLSGTRWLFTPDGTRHPFQGGADRARVLDSESLSRRSEAKADVVVDRPGRVVVDVTVNARAILALTERFHDGWSATIDGGPLRMVRVEDDFLGCEVEAGAHRVTLTFMPRSFVHGAFASALGAVLLGAACLLWRR